MFVQLYVGLLYYVLYSSKAIQSCMLSEGTLVVLLLNSTTLASTSMNESIICLALPRCMIDLLAHVHNMPPTSWRHHQILSRRNQQ